MSRELTIGDIRQLATGGPVDERTRASVGPRIEEALLRASLRLGRVKRELKRRGRTPRSTEATALLEEIEVGGAILDEAVLLVYADAERLRRFTIRVAAHVDGGLDLGRAVERVAAHTVRQWEQRLDPMTQVKNAVRLGVDRAAAERGVERLTRITIVPGRAASWSGAVARGLIAPPLKVCITERTVLVFTEWDKNKGGGAYGFRQADRYLGPPGFLTTFVAQADPVSWLRSHCVSYPKILEAVRRAAPIEVRMARGRGTATQLPNIVRSSVADQAKRVLGEIGEPVDRSSFLRALRELVMHPALRGTASVYQCFDQSARGSVDICGALADWVDSRAERSPAFDGGSRER